MLRARLSPKLITPLLQHSSSSDGNSFDIQFKALERRESAHLFNPPFRTNQLIVHHKDFLVMILRGPNTRLDFHIEPGDEFFYQIEGDMELHLKPPGERATSRYDQTRRDFCLSRRFAAFAAPLRKHLGTGYRAQTPPGRKGRVCLVLREMRRAGPQSSRESGQYSERRFRAVYQEFNDNEQIRTCQVLRIRFSADTDGRTAEFSGTKEMSLVLRLANWWRLFTVSLIR